MENSRKTVLMGINGHLLMFIKNFLDDRKFHVRVGTKYSSIYTQQNGVPQGSVLSVLLFKVTPVKSILFADDFTVFITVDKVLQGQHILQRTIENLTKWSTQNGLKFSLEKTRCMVFSRRRRAQLMPSLYLAGTPIKVVHKTRYLGLMIDSKLTWVSHIRDIRERSQKGINLMRVIAGIKWGADREMLLKVYRSIARSKIDYCSFIYSSARKSTLRQLDTVHNQGIRISLGAFKSSPVLTSSLLSL